MLGQVYEIYMFYFASLHFVFHSLTIFTLPNLAVTLGGESITIQILRAVRPTLSTKEVAEEVPTATAATCITPSRTQVGGIFSNGGGSTRNLQINLKEDQT